MESFRMTRLLVLVPVHNVGHGPLRSLQRRSYPVLPCVVVFFEIRSKVGARWKYLKLELPPRRSRRRHRRRMHTHAHAKSVYYCNASMTSRTLGIPHSGPDTTNVHTRARHNERPRGRVRSSSSPFFCMCVLCFRSSTRTAACRVFFALLVFFSFDLLFAC